MRESMEGEYKLNSTRKVTSGFAVSYLHVIVVSLNNTIRMDNLLKLKHRVEEWPAKEYNESMDLKHDHVDPQTMTQFLPFTTTKTRVCCFSLV